MIHRINYNLKMILISILLIFFVFINCNQAISRDVVCGLHRIQGFENEKVEAERYIGTETTSDITNGEGKIFLTAKDNLLYLQSNYKRNNGLYPIKIATDSQFNDLFLLNLIGNIVGEGTDFDRIVESKGLQPMEAFKDVVKSDITFYLKEDLLTEYNQGIDILNKLNEYGANKVFFISSNTVLKKTELFNKKRYVYGCA